MNALDAITLDELALTAALEDALGAVVPAADFRGARVLGEQEPATGTIIIRKRTPGGFDCRLEFPSGNVRHYTVMASDLIEYEHQGWQIVDPHGYWTEIPFDAPAPRRAQNGHLPATRKSLGAIE
jgi:hypothetical protein